MPFIVFEGLDGSGKSSLMSQIEKDLKNRHQKVLKTREPGGTPLGDEIRNLILRTSGVAPTPRTELLLYEASRAQHVDEVIRPALQANLWVLSDRFDASSIAFQAGGRAISEAQVVWLNSFATNGVQPELTILLDLSVEKSFERRQNRKNATGSEDDRIEKEHRDFHERVRQSFLEQARKNSQSWLVLDAELTVEKLAAQVWGKFEERGWLS